MTQKNEVHEVLSDCSEEGLSSEDESSEQFDKEWEDILGSGAVLKRILRKGRSKIHPEYKQEVLLHVIGKVADTDVVFLDTYKDNSPLLVEIGDMVLEMIDHGVMLAARLMAEGEVSAVKVISRYAYGPKGMPPLIPPNADLEYRLELLSIVGYAKEPAEMTDQELLEAVKRRKERGNFFYQLEEYSKALRCYQQALKFSDRNNVEREQIQRAQGIAEPMLIEDNPVYVDELNDLRVQCINNTATVHEKLDQKKEALDACITLLEFNPKHLKSLLRVARISIEQGNFKEASLALSKAGEYYPREVAVRKLIKTLKERKADYELKKRKAFSGSLKSSPPVQRDSDLQKKKLGSKLYKRGTDGFRHALYSLTILLLPTLVFLIYLGGANITRIMHDFIQEEVS